MLDPSLLFGLGDFLLMHTFSLLLLDIVESPFLELEIELMSLDVVFLCMISVALRFAFGFEDSNGGSLSLAERGAIVSMVCAFCELQAC